MEGPSSFGGEPGESVPQVDPDTLKAAFELYRNYANSPPKPVSLAAVSYRATMLELLTRVPQRPLGPGTTEAGQLEDAVFREAAHIPMEWMGEGLRQRFPFDREELLRRVLYRRRVMQSKQAVWVAC
jgi:hypothetical protein